MKRIELKTHLGDNISVLIKNGCEKSKNDGQYYILKNLNGVTIEIDPDSNYETLNNNFDFALGHNINFIPAHGLVLDDTEKQILIDIANLKNEKYRIDYQISQKEKDLKNYKVNKKLSSRLSSEKMFNIKDEEKYIEMKNKNNDNYGRHCFDMAEKFAALYEITSESEIIDNSISLIKDIDSLVCDDCTGFQHGMMIFILSEFWVNFDDIKQDLIDLGWFNKKE